MNNKRLEKSEIGKKPVCQRWQPTEYQVKIMTNIFNYGNYGVSHLSRTQICEITARLRAYGEAGEYNVYCWFQNHGNRVRHLHSELDPTGTTSSFSPPSLPEGPRWLHNRGLFPANSVIGIGRTTFGALMAGLLRMNLSLGVNLVAKEEDPSPARLAKKRKVGVAFFSLFLLERNTLKWHGLRLVFKSEKN
ncbi:hypothetical protein LR48_Vigan08g146500 [Vigna angularis]|uniref:Uncharacterized protein n=2 Tax=Phaseolus angularis TaxID=3914 RepID=A0A0L9V6M4_PHAAN|nr:uncharacterized protein HKW66_Vig0142420 [Vigna angularis]KOM50638.1 hypothetical protein LR48_Vigan08g146500 [Vigna angularis]BAT90503.1 hypothetical protein VIGAN_06175800 [Vigna angularis var. angularis]